MKSLVLIADDYALSPAVSAGILVALAAGRISGTGAMTNRPFWPADAEKLLPFKGKAELGVHLNLTCGPALTGPSALAPDGHLMPLKALLQGVQRKQVGRALLGAEIGAQLDAFFAAMGCEPDFIDGHQHVHALPGVRAALADALMRRYADKPGRPCAKKPWLRDPGDRFGAILQRPQPRKALMVKLLAGRFAKTMRARGFTLNAGFSGYSAFTGAEYGREFAAALRALGKHPAMMCHPGYVDDALRAADDVVESREHELAFLLSPEFEQICAQNGGKIARFYPDRYPIELINTE